MILLLKVSLHLIHSRVPCLFVLWCFVLSNPINSGGPYPKTHRQLLKGVQVTEGCSSGAEWETKMTLPLELCGRERAADSEATEPLCAARSPRHASYLHHNSCLFSLFIFHAVSWHERELFPSWWRAGYGWLSGHAAHNKLGRGAAFLDSKHQNSLHK